MTRAKLDSISIRLSECTKCFADLKTYVASDSMLRREVAKKEKEIQRKEGVIVEQLQKKREAFALIDTMKLQARRYEATIAKQDEALDKLKGGRNQVYFGLGGAHYDKKVMPVGSLDMISPKGQGAGVFTGLMNGKALIGAKAIFKLSFR